MAAHQVVDTLHDLPNVLWEVAYESSGGGTVTDEFAAFLGMEKTPIADGRHSLTTSPRGGRWATLAGTRSAWD